MKQTTKALKSSGRLKFEKREIFWGGELRIIQDVFSMKNSHHILIRETRSVRVKGELKQSIEWRCPSMGIGTWDLALWLIYIRNPAVYRDTYYYANSKP